MEKIHLQTVTKLLDWDMTYINRANTSENIYEEAKKKVKTHGNMDEQPNQQPKQITTQTKTSTCVDTYKQLKIIIFGKKASMASNYIPLTIKTNTIRKRTRETNNQKDGNKYT